MATLQELRVAYQQAAQQIAFPQHTLQAAQNYITRLEADLRRAEAKEANIR